MTENLSDRINTLIQSLGIRKTTFAEKLNVSQAFVTQITKGVSQPSDRTISDICRLFNVSEVWLREGEGEMFIQLNEDEQLAEVLTRVEFEKDAPFVDMMTAALKSYYKLDDNKKAAVNELIDGMLAEISAQKTAPNQD